jgi:hypothetical protein
MSKGLVFFDVSDNHVWFVISDPDENDNVLIVNCSSIKPYLKHDPSCLLDSCDHSALSKPSFIYYKFAKSISIYKINHRINTREFQTRGIMSPELLQRIQDGASQTELLDKKYEMYFKYF